MRNSVDSSRGVAPQGQRQAGYLVANPGNTAIYFPLTEGTGTTISDLAGISDLTVVGTTTNIWSVPSSGIKLTTDNHVILDLDTLTAEQLARVNSIYDMSGGYTDSIIYFAATIGIAAAPASDTSNYILSMGRRDDVGANPYGELMLRITGQSKPAWHFRSRADTSTNAYSNATTALPTTNTPTSIFTYILPGETSNVPWYTNGASDGTGTLAGLDTTGPIADPVGLSLFGRRISDNTSVGTRLGAGSVEPTVRNLLLGRCSYNAGNIQRLQDLAAYMHFHGRLPSWFAEID